MTEEAFCTEMHRKMKVYLYAAGTVLIIVGLICLAFQSMGYVWIPSCTNSRGGRWGLPEYWRGKGVAEPWDSAPNGWYWVQSGWESSNGTVAFPWCPSCGSRLHGIWNCTVYLPDNFQGDVRLVNNVIVEKK